MKTRNVLKVQLLLFPLYILARTVLIVLAFTLLRDLPKTAFQEVVWTKYIHYTTWFVSTVFSRIEDTLTVIGYTRT
jgi:hypothetical protein